MKFKQYLQENSVPAYITPEWVASITNMSHHASLIKDLSIDINKYTKMTNQSTEVVDTGIFLFAEVAPRIPGTQMVSRAHPDHQSNYVPKYLIISAFVEHSRDNNGDFDEHGSSYRFKVEENLYKKDGSYSDSYKIIMDIETDSASVYSQGYNYSIRNKVLLRLDEHHLNLVKVIWKYNGFNFKEILPVYHRPEDEIEQMEYAD